MSMRFARSDLVRQALFARIDKSLSRKAARLAARKGADVLLYSGYAYEAFRATTGKKILFVYHPHGNGTDRILLQDREAHPEITVSHDWHMAESRTLDSTRLDAELELATEIICASNFTLSTIPSHHLAKPHKVVPYGCDVPESQAAARTPGPVRFLFVGQGVQRKGIHHLLLVWRRLSVCSDAELSFVCGRSDPWVVSEIERQHLPRSSGLGHSELIAAYDSADVLVLPSLVEGFGLVMLEALARGCHVISTTHTGLPDLKLPSWAAQAIKPGNLDELAAAIEKAKAGIRCGEIRRNEIRNQARRLSWSRFRSGVCDAVGHTVAADIR